MTLLDERQARAVALEEGALQMHFLAHQWRKVPAVSEQFRIMADRMAARANRLRYGRECR